MPTNMYNISFFFITHKLFYKNILKLGEQCSLNTNIYTATKNIKKTTWNKFRYVNEFSGKNKPYICDVLCRLWSVENVYVYCNKCWIQISKERKNEKF